MAPTAPTAAARAPEPLAPVAPISTPAPACRLTSLRVSSNTLECGGTTLIEPQAVDIWRHHFAPLGQPEPRIDRAQDRRDQGSMACYDRAAMSRPANIGERRQSSVGSLLQALAPGRPVVLIDKRAMEI